MGRKSVNRLKLQKFQKEIWRYWQDYKRDLPWRRTKNPYRILVSEVMLQQTQVERVIPKYHVFVKRFPDFASVASASVVEVLSLWQGLGYNRRALALKKLSGIVTEKYSGRLPADLTLLKQLPGIGQATAGAIAAFAFNKPVPFIETNIRRVFIFFFFPRKKKVSDEEILRLVRQTLSVTHTREWYFALMDYGAMLGRLTSLKTNFTGIRSLRENPNRRSRQYHTQSRFEGSNRQLRGNIVKLLLAKSPATVAMLLKKMAASPVRVFEALKELEREGFVRRQEKKFFIA